jgi:hypothetical protein
LDEVVHLMADLDTPLFVQEAIPIRDEVARRFKIESVTGHSFDIVNEVQSAHQFRSHALAYDPSGHRILFQEYDRDGARILERTYDSNGRPLREIAYETSGRVSTRFVYVYEGDEAWVEQRVYLSGDALHYKIVSNRDAQGRIVEGVYLEPSGQTIRTDSYLYDDGGRLIQISMGYMGEWIFEYDGGNLAKKTGYLPSASAFGANFEYGYDDRGLLMRMNHLHYRVTAFEYTFFD